MSKAIVSQDSYIASVLNETSVLTCEHEHPVNAIPAGVQDLFIQREVRVGNSLSSVDVTIAVPQCEHGGIVFDGETDEHKPVCCAQFNQITGSSVQEPVRASGVSEILGAIQVVLEGIGRLRNKPHSGKKKMDEENLYDRAWAIVGQNIGVYDRWESEVAAYIEHRWPKAFALAQSTLGTDSLTAMEVADMGAAAVESPEEFLEDLRCVLGGLVKGNELNSDGEWQ